MPKADVTAPLDVNAPEAANAGQGISAGAKEDATKALLSKSKSTPAPGQYAWNDNVNLRKRPEWKMQSPDRKHLDLMIGSWSPASTSLQPRAPDPAEYGESVEGKRVGRNGVFRPSVADWKNCSRRPCLMPDPEPKSEVVFKIKSSVGGKQPLKRSLPSWSVFGKDRSQLPVDLPTWTPKPSTDVRPGPGSYDLDRCGRVGKMPGKAVNRRGCTWGGRGANLHPEDRQWVPKTFGSRLCGGEHSRLRTFNVPSTRCACVSCPGPGHCDDSLS